MDIVTVLLEGLGTEEMGRKVQDWEAEPRTQGMRVTGEPFVLEEAVQQFPVASVCGEGR
jgi:hypothetical protein